MSNRRRRSYGGGRGRKKYCAFCAEHVVAIDYKDVNTLERYIAESKKIMPRRMTGVCAKHQRALTNAIRRSRHVALLPYTEE
ncbi:MAG: 30S ribosomal protein S18 [Saccharofermentanales bacterium]|jgi:small subunit ribosomal protein S18|nr:30S ribosomal protein S18 [Eubacteriales bacterium]MDD3611342.1 30S ribosomal protein S18 [Eubacteriales bacterium]HHU04726.1 30S ribosomal protein S18 [Fastidiosipila sp.]